MILSGWRCTALHRQLHLLPANISMKQQGAIRALETVRKHETYWVLENFPSIKPFLRFGFQLVLICHQLHSISLIHQCLHIHQCCHTTPPLVAHNKCVTAKLTVKPSVQSESTQCTVTGSISNTCIWNMYYKCNKCFVFLFKLLYMNIFYQIFCTGIWISNTNNCICICYFLSKI